MKDKFVGVVVTIISSMLMYLTYAYFGSFETKAGSSTKFNDLSTKIDRVDGKIDKVICYLDNKQCLIEGK